MPAMAMAPNNTSIARMGRLEISGSKKAVKNPEPEIQTTAMDTLPYFTLP